MEKHRFTSIDEYHGTFPENVRSVLAQMRATIREAAPDAEEVISYNMPAFRQNGIVVYYAGWKEHIGLYATPSGNAAFKDELEPYDSGKGSLKFPLKEPLPLDLISRIVRFRVNENNEKALLKKNKK